MAQACVILFSLLCVIVADCTDASGSGDPPLLVSGGNLGGDSAVGRSNPFPLLLLVPAIVVVALVVMAGGCCIAVCCFMCCCRYKSRRLVDHSRATSEPEIELYGNPAFQYREPESNNEGVFSSQDSPRTKRVPKFTQSSQSVITRSTPRLAVSRPISTSVFTIHNKGALQIDAKFELHASASPNDSSAETRSLPVMSNHNLDQRNLQPGQPAGPESLSQTTLPSHVEPTAPTSASEPQETEV